jgi:Uma2 family endonuclease
MGLMQTKRKFKNPPRTAMEVFEMLPEGTLAEVINNLIYMSPSPTVGHQVLLSNLQSDINLFIRSNNLGICMVAPIDIYLMDNNVVQPDIVFISNANFKIIKDEKVKGVPDLLIEILSGNRNHDLEVKKNLYEKAGVKEYFIIDPSDKAVITYYYDSEKFIIQESKKGKIKSKLLKKVFTF